MKQLILTLPILLLLTGCGPNKSFSDVLRETVYKDSETVGHPLGEEEIGHLTQFIELTLEFIFESEEIKEEYPEVVFHVATIKDEKMEAFVRNGITSEMTEIIRSSDPIYQLRSQLSPTIEGMNYVKILKRDYYLPDRYFSQSDPKRQWIYDNLAYDRPEISEWSDRSMSMISTTQVVKHLCLVLLMQKLEGRPTDMNLESYTETHLMTFEKQNLDITTKLFRQYVDAERVIGGLIGPRANPSVEARKKFIWADRELSGSQGLLRAVETGQVQAVQNLLEAGVNANVRDEEEGLTALLLAVHEENTAIVKLLIAAGADIHQRVGVGEYQSTVLIWAIESGVAEMVEILLAAGADVDDFSTVLERRRTAVEIARDSGNFEIIKILKRYTSERDQK